MNTILRAFQVIWTLAAWFLILSAVAAPVVALVIKARARGRRLFRDEPTARVRALHPDHSHLHEQDAL